jgi:hypothetical protein
LTTIIKILTLRPNPLKDSPIFPCFQTPTSKYENFESLTA